MKRFYGKIDTTGECHEWTAGKNKKGYGIFLHNGKCCLAHRVLWELEGREFAEVLRHKCDNPGCCNIDHLEPGTVADNNNDKMERGRFRPNNGSKNGQSKLTEDDVRQIKAMLAEGRKQRDIAKAFNTVPHNISMIKTGRAWAWLA
jgi:hypothetical protein